jgi:hypothetical protein
MLNDNQMLILLLVVLGLILLVKVGEARFNRNASARGRTLNSIKAHLIIYGIVIVGLWLALPSSQDFRLLDYPKEFKSLDDVHTFLNQQSKMLQRFSEIVQTFLLALVIFFLLDLYRGARSILAYIGPDKNTAAQQIVRSCGK